MALAQFRKLGRELPIDHSVVEALNHRVEGIERMHVEGRESVRGHLQDCVGRLPQSFREAIEVTYRGERSVAQAAQAAEVGVEAMKKRLQRARAMLADCLRGKGVLG